MKNYYHIVNQSVSSNQTYMFEIALHPDCTIYEGHFPSKPIAPGACNIEMIRQCASKAQNKYIHFASVDTCKFLMLINPLEHKALNLAITFNSNTVSATLSVEASVAIKFRATIK
ncbi:MAG: hypothetical protein MJ003_03710 [Paludibacteraceae bacterium]|nr:hypothetical protein [Paludibacteraceae bacterium]